MEEMGKNPVDPPPSAAGPRNDPPNVNGAPLHDRLTSAPALVPAPPGNQITTAVPAAHPIPAAQARDKDKSTPAEPKDGVREIIDTIVIVVVLVLLLKSFLAEAFVIPTGSMATTLLGYHKPITCPQCGHEFEVNLSKQVDTAEEDPQPITGCRCPNCRLRIELIPPEQLVQPRKGPEQ